MIDIRVMKCRAQQQHSSKIVDCNNVIDMMRKGHTYWNNLIVASVDALQESRCLVQPDLRATMAFSSMATRSRESLVSISLTETRLTDLDVPANLLVVGPERTANQLYR